MFNIKNLDQEAIKETNRKKILRLLLQKKELTKQNIAAMTGLSIPTVITNINNIIDEGIAQEAGVADSTGGRKPVIIRFIPDSRYSIGVDIKTKETRIVVSNLDGEIKHQSILEANHNEDFENRMNSVCTQLKQMMASMDRCKLLGIGFSLPGTVDEEELSLVAAPNLGINNYNFKSIRQQLDAPVFIENEAKAAAFAELSYGIAKEMKNLVYVSITDGIGTGIIIQDYIYKGKNKRAGEFGHMIIKMDGKKCRCGRSGCWEMYASQKALQRSYIEKSGCANFSMKDFFERVENHEPIAEDVLDKYLTYLAIGIQNIIMIQDPHYVIIGGEISEYGDAIIKRLSDKVYIPNSFYTNENTKIMFSHLKSNASAIGAALLPMQDLFNASEKII